MNLVTHEMNMRQNTSHSAELSSLCGCHRLTFIVVQSRLQWAAHVPRQEGEIHTFWWDNLL